MNEHGFSRKLLRQNVRTCELGFRGNLSNRNGTKKKIFKGLFCNFPGINTHNFVKNEPKFENKTLFNAKSYRA